MDELEKIGRYWAKERMKKFCNNRFHALDVYTDELGLFRYKLSYETPTGKVKSVSVSFEKAQKVYENKQQKLASLHTSDAENK